MTAAKTPSQHLQQTPTTSRLQHYLEDAGLANGEMTLSEYTPSPTVAADVVCLPYTLDGGDGESNRRQILLDAWQACRQVLAVAAAVTLDSNDDQQLVLAENMFAADSSQSYFHQEELQRFIAATLNLNSHHIVPAALGIFFVFRHPHRKQQYLFSRYATTNASRQNLLIYLAATKPPWDEIPPSLQQQILDEFETYDRAIEICDRILQQIQQPHQRSELIQSSTIGKKLPTAVYVHTSAISHLDPRLQLLIAIATQKTGKIAEANIVKFALDAAKLSYLFYPDFDTHPHPPLQASLQLEFDFTQQQPLSLRYRQYETTDNPPILHRKETLVATDYPHYETFAKLTRQESYLGLLDNPQQIGTQKAWQRRLDEFGVKIVEHQVYWQQQDSNAGEVAADFPKQPFPQIEIQRHRAAIARKELSRPVRLALELGLFAPGTTFFDYGCGHGGDVSRIAKRGYESAGWDPYYVPDAEIRSADIVNLGYVINVIEDQAERQEALVRAWHLTNQILIVSAQVLIEDRQGGHPMAYGDGIITRRNTFQKYYDQEELKTYIDQVLGVDSVAIGLGIYLVFRDENQAGTFRASQFRSRTRTPRIRQPSKRFEDYQDMLQPLIDFISDRGRLPKSGELSCEEEIKSEFGTFYQAFQLILQATDMEEWDEIRERRCRDLLVYLALSKFDQRSLRKQLTPNMKADIKAFFGSQRSALALAEQLLYKLSDMSLVRDRCRESHVGDLDSQGLSVHISALSELEPLLRVYEGCASCSIGRMESANVIKLHGQVPQVTYLYYPDFDTNPHPVLQSFMKVDLRNLHVTYGDLESDSNPPILHRKDALVMSDYPGYEKFARLTRQEEKWGLLDDRQSIQTKKAWERCLQEYCATLKGHRVCWREDADPDRVRVIENKKQLRRQS